MNDSLKSKTNTQFFFLTEFKYAYFVLLLPPQIYIIGCCFGGWTSFWVSIVVPEIGDSNI